MAESSAVDPNVSELEETIQELSAYRDRLRNDVLTLGQKLRLPKAKVEASIADHPELQRIDEILIQLQGQLA
ncbi:hypothetical protein [Synechococcus sp. Cruz CV12-2-Slac-r]|uniref:hypothetical protein n=1 Tax=Synechococcus sp. Cruz CV12-2-Slac-r TaxID=2823748 RepID=UPI0020CCADED|nr:hypothetical protein [Synechococcus sp. Cruz CV12-2-Slac-r]MCP9938755.1 hypothetical protein [Synechococcus sp. Cruz CV12-2-Slac-r]